VFQVEIDTAARKNRNKSKDVQKHNIINVTHLKIVVKSYICALQPPPSTISVLPIDYLRIELDRCALDPLGLTYIIISIWVYAIVLFGFPALDRTTWFFCARFGLLRVTDPTYFHRNPHDEQ
jgi:hypothetical protein